MLVGIVGGGDAGAVQGRRRGDRLGRGRGAAAGVASSRRRLARRIRRRPERVTEPRRRAPGAEGLSSSATSARSSCASVGTRTIRARSTTLIWPLSSETTTATASVSSVMPSAARWRVPNRSDRLISVSGRSAAAARMPSPRMIDGAVVELRPGREDRAQELVREVGVDHHARSRRSPRGPSRARGRSGRRVPRATASPPPWTTSAATCSLRRCSDGASQLSDPTRPIRSSPRRSSGWNTTTSANRPTTAPAWSSWVNSRSWRNWARA